MSIPEFGNDNDESPFAEEKKMIVNLKKAILMLRRSRSSEINDEAGIEQEILMNIADMAIADL